MFSYISEICIIVAIYNACPRNYKDRIWWNTTAYDVTVYEPCPKGAVGRASRHCSRQHLWLPPNTFSCTSMNFLMLNNSVRGPYQYSNQSVWLTVNSVQSEWSVGMSIQSEWSSGISIQSEWSSGIPIQSEWSVVNFSLSEIFSGNSDLS